MITRLRQALVFLFSMNLCLRLTMLLEFLFRSYEGVRVNV